VSLKEKRVKTLHLDEPQISIWQKRVFFLRVKSKLTLCEYCIEALSDIVNIRQTMEHSSAWYSEVLRSARILLVIQTLWDTQLVLRLRFLSFQ
jgi:hypothetical protein